MHVSAVDVQNFIDVVQTFSVENNLLLSDVCNGVTRDLSIIYPRPYSIYLRGL